ncbi:MAG: guanylate kinase [Candidatus Bipolaricaulota bacterium]|nr:guanylate kinase [Candidatus Bipolaricaulota bacterium]MDW8110642.1 guanylate kinase [Candidatus Bipolaricaulota bacterium]MDW8328500.1 guanylate kinase [Candidatus Bipolaricaulota bacterium]
MKKRSPGIFFVICGPSGAGKTTLLNHVRQRFPDLHYVPSYTSRPPRSAAERRAGRYRFVSVEEFQRLIRQRAFLEYAQYAGNYYGTARALVNDHLEAGRDLIKEADVQGMRQLRRRRLPGRLVGIFILPPSLEELERRLSGRGTEDPEAQRQRLSAALNELGGLHLFDYVVVNRNVRESVERLSAVIRVERARRS